MRVTKSKSTKSRASVLELTDDPNRAYKYFNMKKVIDTTGIQQDKMYNNLKGEYDSFTDEDKKKIAGALTPAIKSLFKMLGYEVKFIKEK